MNEYSDDIFLICEVDQTNKHAGDLNQEVGVSMLQSSMLEVQP
jgi:hypothetical protein